MAVATFVAGAVLMLVGLPFLRLGDPDNQELTRLHLQQLRDAMDSSSSSPKVVVLGASVIKRAIVHGDQFTALAVEMELPPVQVIRLVAPGGLEVIDDSVLAMLAEIKPAVLLVQDHTLFYNNPRYGYAGFSRFAHNRVLRWLGFSKDRRSPAQRIRNFYDAEEDIRRLVSDSDIAQHRRERQRQYTGRPRRDVIQAMETCAQAGGKVFILPIASDPRWESIFEPQRAEIRQHLDRIIAAKLAEELVCPLTFVGDDFLDLRHFSKMARDRYSRWLIGELSARWKP